MSNKLDEQEYDNWVQATNSEEVVKKLYAQVKELERRLKNIEDYLKSDSFATRL